MHHGPDSQLSFALTVRGLAKHFGQLFDPTLHATIPSSQHLFAVVQPHKPPPFPFWPFIQVTCHPPSSHHCCRPQGPVAPRSLLLVWETWQTSSPQPAPEVCFCLCNAYVSDLTKHLPCLSKISFVQLQIMYLFNSVYIFTSHISAFCWGSIWGFNQDPCPPRPHRCWKISLQLGIQHPRVQHIGHHWQLGRRQTTRQLVGEHHLVL